MKKLFFVFAMTAFAANIFAGGCLHRPGANDGRCMTSTYGGEVHYYCVDPGVLGRDCVKGGDVDEG